MSARTAQCRECTDVFECGPTGRLPVLCPKCRKDAGERSTSAAKPRKKAARPVEPSSSPAIATAILALTEEIETLEAQIESRRTALEALEAVA